MKSPRIVAALLVIVLSFVASFATFLNGEHYSRPQARLEMQERELTFHPALDQSCVDYTGESKLFSFYRRSEPKMQPTVALIGDSHASDLFPSLAELHAKRGQGVINIGSAVCVFNSAKLLARDNKDLLVYDGEFLFSDGEHLTAAGSRLVVNGFLRSSCVSK